MIRILQRYVFLELVKVFLLAAAALSGIFFLVMSVVFWQKWGVSVAQLVVTMPFIFPTVLNLSLPMATLVTCTVAYGRLSADNEILAIQSAGVHLGPIVAPALILGLALCPLTLALSFDFIPRNEQKAFVKARQNVDAIVKLLAIQKRVEVQQQDSTLIISIGRAVSNRFLDVSIRQDVPGSREGSKTSIEIHAKEGYITSSEKPMTFVFHLYDGSLMTKDPSGGLENVVGFKSQLREISVAGYRERLRPNFMTQEQLWDTILDAAAQSAPERSLKELRKLWTEIHERWVLSFTCFAFAMLGVPLGVFSRKGNFLGAFATGCLPVFLLYYPMLIVGKSMAQSGALPVALAMWAPDVAIAALGALLLLVLFRR